MSSDGSRTTSSSRLSQFGLYRTIDARTEEFLRLSRKRQIRQGCACAAVSTAITVTVVVTVLLVYEYGINLDTKSDQKQSKKQNWFGLFNESSAFDSKMNKGKINFDISTLKLLPLIIKALGHNKYLEKLLDDSTQSTIPTKKADLPRDKNTYGNGRNKIVNPISNSRKAQLQRDNLKYFMKARKMRDDERLKQYFDKMVGDKSGTVTKVPETDFEKEDDIKHILFGMTTKYEITKPTTHPTTKKTRTTTKISKQLNPIEISSDHATLTDRQYRGTVANGCKCPSQFNSLLAKLISAFQELLPEIVIAKSRCSEKETTKQIERDKNILSRDIKKTQENNITTTTIKATTIQNLKKAKLFVKSTTEQAKKLNRTKWYYTYKTSNKTTTQKSIENVLFHELLMPTLVPNDVVSKYVTNTNNFYINTINNSERKDSLEDIENIIKNFHPSTTVKNYLDPPITGYYLKPDTTIAMNAYLQNTKTTTTKTTTHESTTKKYNLKTTSTIRPIGSTFSSKDIKFRIFNVEKEISENLNQFINKNEETTTTAISDKPATSDKYATVNINDLNLFSFKKVGDVMIPLPLTAKNDFLVKVKRFEIAPSTTEALTTRQSDSDLNPTNAAEESQLIKNGVTWKENERKAINKENDFQKQQLLNKVKSLSYNNYSQTRYNMTSDDNSKATETNEKYNKIKSNKDNIDNVDAVLMSMLPENERRTIHEEKDFRVKKILKPVKSSSQNIYIPTKSNMILDDDSKKAKTNGKMNENKLNKNEIDNVNAGLKSILSENERRTINEENDFEVQEILNQDENIVKSSSYNKYSPTGSNIFSDDDFKAAENNGKRNENKSNKDNMDVELKTMLSENERRAINDENDFQVQEILKQVENIVKSPLYNKYSPTRSNMNEDSKTAEIIGKRNDHKWNKDKKDSMDVVLKSMLPQIRPTYLVINRHPDFKFEAPHDEYLTRNAYSQMK